MTEILVAVLYVRNQIDVGHIRIRTLTKDDLSNIHQLLLEASLIIEWLLKHVAERIGEETYSLPDFQGSKGKDLTLSRVAEALAALDNDDHRVYLNNWSSRKGRSD